MNQLLLFTINLLIISSFAVEQLVFTTQQILHIIDNPTPNLIDGKFIVFFDIDCLAQQTVDVIQEFLDLFNCYELIDDVIDLFPDTVNHWIYMDRNTLNPNCNLPEEDSRTINYDDYCLESVEPDQLFETFGTNQCKSRTVASTLWNLDSVSPPITDGIQYVEYDETYNPNIDIIIMDSGVAFNHEQFNNIITRRLFDAFPSETTFDDHGSHVAGTVIGKNYGAFRAANTQIKLLDVRIFPTNGGTSSTNILNGYDSIIDYLERNTGKKAIINMSFGGPNSNQYNRRLARIRSAGGISFAAAGNDNNDASLTSPASSIDTITVGALNRNPPNTRASFSNYDLGVTAPLGLNPLCRYDFSAILYPLLCGPRRRIIDIWAPGVDIKSAVNGPNGDESDLKSGTSMATPLVAGIAANILASNPSFDFDDINGTLINNALHDVNDGRGSTGLPRVQATCEEYAVQRDIYFPDISPKAKDYYYEYPDINTSTQMSKYMVEGFVIILWCILVCFIMLYCNQRSYNEANEGSNSYKVVDFDSSTDI